MANRLVEHDDNLLRNNVYTRFELAVIIIK